MFIPNKYTMWYFRIINSSKNRIGYTERHHIIPKCIGGNNKKENIISLTPKEHFICHWLLTKMTSGKNKTKMCYAFWSMTRKNSKTRRCFTSIQYDIAKKCVVSVRKNKTFEEIYGIEKATSIKRKMSEKQKGIPKPNSWKNLPKENKSSKQWEVIYPCGKIEIIYNLAKFCRQNNLHQGNLSKHGKSKGFIVSFL